jgi:hypothetical protein
MSVLVDEEERRRTDPGVNCLRLWLYVIRAAVLQVGA